MAVVFKAAIKRFHFKALSQTTRCKCTYAKLIFRMEKKNFPCFFSPYFALHSRNSTCQRQRISIRVDRTESNQTLIRIKVNKKKKKKMIYESTFDPPDFDDGFELPAAQRIRNKHPRMISTCSVDDLLAAVIVAQIKTWVQSRPHPRSPVTLWSMYRSISFLLFDQLN